jgi:hypothetical protein
LSAILASACFTAALVTTAIKARIEITHRTFRVCWQVIAAAGMGLILTSLDIRSEYSPDVYIMMF